MLYIILAAVFFFLIALAGFAWALCVASAAAPTEEGQREKATALLGQRRAAEVLTAEESLARIRTRGTRNERRNG